MKRLVFKVWGIVFVLLVFLVGIVVADHQCHDSYIKGMNHVNLISSFKEGLFIILLMIKEMLLHAICALKNVVIFLNSPTNCTLNMVL